MSGATLAYDLRRNKHVERQLFLELLFRFSCWKDLKDYLYIGFGGVYFEEFKLLHTRFQISRMISLEREEWMLPRQELNVPYGCIKPIHGVSSDLVLKLEEYRRTSDCTNTLIWLDYTSSKEFPTQLNEVRSLVSKLENGDILKVTLSLNPGWLNKGTSSDTLTNRLENLRNQLGSTYLAEGISSTDVTNNGLAIVYINALQRKIAEGLTENSALEFLPLGCYTYNDSSSMLTVTGALVSRDQVEEYKACTRMADFDLSSSDWKIHSIDVPDLSLRERLELDRRLNGRTAEQIGADLGFRFEADEDESLSLIRNYMKLYRFYPNLHRVQL